MKTISNIRNRIRKRIRNNYKLVTKHLRLIIDLKIHNIPKLINFFNSYRKYKFLANAEELKISDFYPRINDDTPTTPFDAHYFYQGVWAFRKIKESRIKNHVDVGSEIGWLGLLSSIAKVSVIDIRPFKTD